MTWRSAFRLASSGGAKARPSILIFHRVLVEPGSLFPEELCTIRFDALYPHLCSRFEVLPLLHAIVRSCEGALPSGALAKSFDDGYVDDLLIAALILREHGSPATFFIATRNLDGGCMWNDRVIGAFRATRISEIDLVQLGLQTYRIEFIADRCAGIEGVIAGTKCLSVVERNERKDYVSRVAGVAPRKQLMLDSTSVGSLEDFDIDVEVHIVKPPILARTPSKPAFEEILKSKRRFEWLTRRSVRLFAHSSGMPSQDCSAKHVRMVREAGFDAAVSTAWGAATREGDVFQLPRIMSRARQPLKFDPPMLHNQRQPAEQRAA